MTSHFRFPTYYVAALLLGLLAFSLSAAEEPIDWNKAQQLHQRVQRGDRLTPEEQAYYDRARALRTQRQGQPKPSPAALTPWTNRLAPLTELGTAKYKDQDGGLYGGGQNTPPAAHAAAARQAAAEIRPLDAEGRTSPSGKIGLLSIGMSNTTQEYSRFKAMADRDPEKSPNVVIVDGAQGGQTGVIWAQPNSRPWTELENRLQRAGLTLQQVQVVWMKQADAGPARLGEFPAHAKILQGHLAATLWLLKEKFPNLRLAYLSSRIYAGYATTPLNPEPFAYESAFAVRWLIQEQIAGKPELNFDPSRGPVKSPLLLWGPYLWADGVTPRASGGVIWERKDLAADGTHPSGTSGADKVAQLLLSFFKTDPTARGWFTGSTR